MKEYLNPDKIQQDIANNKISIKDALKLYESILTKSDNEDLRHNVIMSLGNFSVEREEIFKILEISLISDESERIRYASAIILTEKFSDYDISPLLWALESERSIFFFKNMLNQLDKRKTLNSDILRDKILNKISIHYNLTPLDSKFILDVDYLDYLKFRDELSEFSKKFHPTELEIQELIKENTQLGYKGLSRVRTSQNKYITDLDLNELDEIPDSICNLTKLNTLRISHCNLKKGPQKCPILESLDSLVMVNNDLEFIPNWVINYANQERNIQKYIDEGVITFEAYILVLMEILSGRKCNKINETPNIEHFFSVCYSLNDNGNIIGLYYSNKNLQIGIIPKQICELKYLKELTLTKQKVKEIPDCFIKLQHLKELNLKENKITFVPEKIIQLKNIELVDLRKNPFKNIPNSISNSDRFKI